MFDIPEFSSHVWISAFNCTCINLEETLRAAQSHLGDVCVQLVDLNKVAGSRYLFLATYSAVKSFHSKQPISRTLAMELLLYASADRQISEAIRRVGISGSTKETAALAVASSTETLIAARGFLEKQLGTECSDVLLDSWSKDRLGAVQENFSISSKELSATLRKNEDLQNAIERLAIERSSLLSVRR